MKQMTNELKRGLIKYAQKINNEVYNPSFFVEESRIKIFYGGSGSGKSHHVTLEVMLKLLTMEGHNAVFFIKQGNRISKTIWPKAKKVLNELLGDARDEYVSLAEHIYTMKFYNGNQAIFSGLFDEENLKSLDFENSVATMVIFEEATDYIESELDESFRRQRGPTEHMKQTYIMFNPINILHWIYNKYFKSEEQELNFNRDGRFRKYEQHLKDLETGETFIRKISILQTTYRDNRYLTPEDRAELLAIKDPVQKQIYVEGNFGVMNDENAIINFSDLIKSTEGELETKEDDILIIGVDVAGEGKDSSEIRASYSGVELKLLDKEKKPDTTSTTVLAKKIVEITEKLQNRIADKHGITPETILNIDKTGIGTGTRDRLKDYVASGELNARVNGIDNGARANEPEKFVNKVSEMYFLLKYLIEEGKAKLQYDEATFTEYATRHYKYDYGQFTRIIIEKKSDYKKRLGKSPDKADALVLAFYNPKKKGSWVL